MTRPIAIDRTSIKHQLTAAFGYAADWRAFCGCGAAESPVGLCTESGLRIRSEHMGMTKVQGMPYGVTDGSPPSALRIAVDRVHMAGFHNAAMLRSECPRCMDLLERYQSRDRCQLGELADPTDPDEMDTMQADCEAIGVSSCGDCWPCPTLCEGHISAHEHYSDAGEVAASEYEERERRREYE